MLLAIDIGNSFTKFGIFDEGELFHKFAIATRRDYAPDELHFDRFEFVEDRFVRIDKVVVSSVVPELNSIVREASLGQFKVTPQFIDHSANFGFVNLYEPPVDAGIDRLINASAAVREYGKPVVVCSFGTATTIDAVNAKGEYLGGVIAPGMAIMAEALYLKAAQLPKVEIGKPESIIGRTTTGAIQSGVFYGYLGQVDSLIRRVSKEISQPARKGQKKVTPRIVATGGFARVIMSEIDSIDTVDENLTLEGLRYLAGEPYNVTA